MGLHLISSNRVEILVDKLSTFLFDNPLSSPFTNEVVIVPSMVMSQWVNQQLAQKQGIVANISYPLLASWIWQLTSEVIEEVPKKEPLGRDLATWKVFELLPNMLEQKEFASLQHYLVGDDSGLKRWQLATRIADVFDRYQFYRPDWIKKWSTGEDSDWQALLWQELIKDLNGTHRVELLEKLMDKVNSGIDSNQLPERISLFALSNMPPLFVEVLNVLSTHTEVYLYQHSPTNQYWADLKSKKEISYKRISNPDEAAYYDTGHELLASWGRQGQVLQDILLNNTVMPTVEHEDYQAPDNNSLLSSIQHDIFNLDDCHRQVEQDDSVQVNICYSELRECQVLHDQLLRQFEQDKNLKPEDILVMVPEISRYAPYIEAVFSHDESNTKPYIPWNLSDVSIADEHPLVRTFFQLLNLPSSRFSFSEVISYFDVPELAKRFDLDEQACDDITDIFQQTNVRWGIDEKHKEQLGLPSVVENTWKQAEDRLFSGYAMGNIDSWDDIAPAQDIEGNKAVSLGKFCKMFDRLQYWRTQLDCSQSATAWQEMLNNLLSDFFSDIGDEEGKLQQIRDILDELHQQAAELELSSVLVRHWLNNSLGSQSGRSRAFSGGITFCGMQNMRSLPFKVICLLGMNDNAYPRRDRAPEFDQMSDHWRPGDPRKGDADRYLLLETILCARNKLYLSYIGRSVKDNTECQPSVLVRELLDYIDEHYSLNDDSTKISKAISTLHPMQSFSIRNYQNIESNNLKQSYDSYWCEIADAINTQSASSVEQVWPESKVSLNSDEFTEIELNRLHRFVQHPVKYFFNTRLNIYLQEEQVNEDEELFSLDALQKWQLKSTLINYWFDDKDVNDKHLRAEGMLPHGSFSKLYFDNMQKEIIGLREGLDEYRECVSESCKIDIKLDNSICLSGQVNQYYPGKGLLHYTSSKLKGKGILRLWIEHLVLCASEKISPDEISVLICNDASWEFRHTESKIAIEQLNMYLGYYQQGMQRPLPLFPESSYAFALDKKGKGLEYALNKWEGSGYNNISGEDADDYICIAMRGVTENPIYSDEFNSLSKAFYTKAFEYGAEQ